ARGAAGRAPGARRPLPPGGTADLPPDPAADPGRAGARAHPALAGARPLPAHRDRAGVRPRGRRGAHGPRRRDPRLPRRTGGPHQRDQALPGREGRGAPPLRARAAAPRGAGRGPGLRRRRGPGPLRRGRELRPARDARPRAAPGRPLRDLFRSGGGDHGPRGAAPRAFPGGTRAMIRVLLADDHTLVRQGLAQILKGAVDVEVVAQAGDGSEAVETALETKPDVVVLDVSMPRLSGLEAARRIKKELPRSRVLALTMHDEDEFILKMVRAGVSGYLVKDSAASELLAAIRALAAGK